MNGLEVFSVALIGVLCLALVKQSSGVYSALIRLILVVLVAVCVLPELRNLFDILSVLQLPDDISIDSLKIMLKVFGILSLGAVVGDICRDNGESALATTVELSTRILAVAVSLPVISAVITLAVAFMNG